MENLNGTRHPILIVEDDGKLARVLQVYLEGAGYRTVRAATGAQALEAFSLETPLLVLLDLMLPDMPGESLAQEFRKKGNVPIIMVTARSSEEERIAGFALGADDYVVKPFSPRELVYRVRALLKRAGGERKDREKPLSFNGGGLVLDGTSYETWKDGEPVFLTPTEFKILLTLASAPERVWSRDQLIRRALGYAFEGYDRTVDAHVKNIRQKIGDDPRRPVFIQTLYGVGYRFAGKRDHETPVE